jgi:regulator of cell morphogenesis and NO signaling
MTTTTEKTVREIAIENPATIRVFETLGIDYCCGGKRSLSDACLQANVPMAQVVELLATAGRDTGEDNANSWNDAPLHVLTAHIVTKHHAFVRQETPRIESLLQKVISRHGDRHPEVRRIQELFLAMAQELSTHMMKEEQILFPYIDRMETALLAGEPLPKTCFESISSPIANMMADHEDAGALLASIRELSSSFAPPVGACPTYRGLYHSLAEFESDLHRHVHLENNILFPRAAQMEAAAGVACGNR